MHNLMEDAATAEISRSQLWQWARHGVRLAEGPTVTPDLIRRVQAEELGRLRVTLGETAFAQGHFATAAEILDL